MRKKPARPSRQAQDRRLRERVFGQIASPDNQAEVTIKNMDLYIYWIKTGRRPGAKPRIRLATDDGWRQTDLEDFTNDSRR